MTGPQFMLLISHIYVAAALICGAVGGYYLAAVALLISVMFTLCAAFLARNP